jgi:NAD(P)-dependent dehydrogenase (short-subunit alcohol dehydrogenase family)
MRGHGELKDGPRGLLALAHNRPPCASMIERQAESPSAKPLEWNLHHSCFDVVRLAVEAAAFKDVTVEDYDFVMGLNVRAAYFVAQAVAKRLIDAGEEGSIINMSSQMGHVGGINRSLYCTSKWAIEGFSKAMALDLAPHRIRVNTIAPTFIETPMTKPFFDDDRFKEYVLSKIKLGRLGKVQDLTGAVIFLASDASSLMTGSSILVDGGWTAD